MLQMTGERQVATDLSGIKPDHRQRYEFAVKILEELNNPVVMDAACGVGYGTYIMAKAGHTTIGVDLSQDAIDMANTHYSVKELTQYYQRDVVRDDFPDLPIDVIVSFETVEHVQEDEILLSKFSRTAPYLIVSVPNEEVVPYTKETHPFHFKHYSPAEFEALLEKTGWIPLEWYTQYDKSPGMVYEADDGRSLIVFARSKECM